MVRPSRGGVLGRAICGWGICFISIVRGGVCGFGSCGPAMVWMALMICVLGEVVFGLGRDFRVDLGLRGGR